MRQPIGTGSLRHRFGLATGAGVFTLAAGVLWLGAGLPAGAQAAPNLPPPPPVGLRPLHSSGNGAPAAGVPAPAAIVAAPAVPPAPKWPVNEMAAQPKVEWDSKGLQIEAANSSLRQILDEVAMRTGAKVEGLTTDERVFGDYGPGQARDVLSQLLHGSQYNVLMLGDEGAGTPAEIVLSARTSGGNGGPARNNPGQMQGAQDEDATPEPDTQQEEPQPFGNNRPQGAPRTPQQMLQELQQRQQQMQENQQQPH